MRFKVLVCGTTFGQSYMRAISENENLELVGIYANGSKRSIDCSKKYNVPLFKNVTSLPFDIDMAFVIVKSSVLGGEGTKIAKQLLNRGIHVMQEHPINYNEISECCRIAVKNKVCYKVGDLYPFLESIKKFCDTSLFLNTNDRFKYASIISSSQGLYSLSAILANSLSNYRNFTIDDRETKINYPFTKLKLTNGEEDIFLQIHNEVSENDGNNHMHLLHRMIFFYDSGRLELNDTFGGLCWRSRMNISESDVYQKKTKHDYDFRPMSINLIKEEENSYDELLRTIFPNAIEKQIEEFIKEIREGTMDIAVLQKEILISEKWSVLSSVIGFPKLVNFSANYIDYTPMLKRGEE